MNILALARGFIQLVVLLTEISPAMVKLWRAWEKSNGRLSSTDRKRIADTVKTAVATKDTTDLEAFLTGKSELPK